jgi:hypothetical protein
VFVLATVFLWDAQFLRGIRRYGPVYVSVLGAPDIIPPPEEGLDSGPVISEAIAEESAPEARSELYSVADEKQQDKAVIYKGEGKITPSDKSGGTAKAVDQSPEDGTGTGTGKDTGKGTGKSKDNDGKDDKTEQPAEEPADEPIEEEIASEPPEAAPRKAKDKKTGPILPPEPVGEPAAEPATEPTETGGQAEGRLPEPSYLIDTQAMLITRGQLEYPPAFKNLDVSAVSIIDIYLDSRGGIRSMEIIQSGGTEFDEAAFRMILSSTFAPAYSGDLAVPCIVRLTVEFESKAGTSE